MTTFGITLDHGLELPIAETARMIEDLGFDYLASGEHMSFRRATGNGFITLSVAAGATTRIGLVSSITLLPLYPALVAAKMTAELSRHSGGRFELGVGAGGDYPPEFAACGVPLTQRQARADEALEVLRRLWREERVTFSGRFTTLEDIGLTPRPTPPPPVWVAGRKQRAMARAARHGDVWMPYMYTMSQLARSIETVRELAHENGRDPSSIAMALYATIGLGDSRAAALDRVTTILGQAYGTDMRDAVERFVVAGTPAECVEQLHERSAAGVERFILAPVTAAAEYVEVVREIAANVIAPLRAGQTS